MAIKMNIVARCSFVAAAQVASQVILDEKGAEEIPSIPGRAIYKVEKKRTIQVPYIDDKQMFNMMEVRKDAILNAGKSRKPVNDDRPVKSRKD
jgi:S-DNA-T family DNA segregation ATPase FtsK/SpoIIIE